MKKNRKFFLRISDFIVQDLVTSECMYVVVPQKFSFAIEVVCSTHDESKVLLFSHGSVWRERVGCSKG